MDKLQLTGRNLGRVFNFRFGHLRAEHFWCYQVKLPDLKLKTRPKQTSRFSPVSYCAPRFVLIQISKGKKNDFGSKLKFSNNKLIYLFLTFSKDFISM